MPALGANIGDFLPFSRGSRAVPFKMQNLRRDPSPMDERSKSTTGWNGSTGISFISSPEYPSSGRRTEIRFFPGIPRLLD
jgi:hypothetical protein